MDAITTDRLAEDVAKIKQMTAEDADGALPAEWSGRWVAAGTEDGFELWYEMDYSDSYTYIAWTTIRDGQMVIAESLDEALG